MSSAETADLFRHALLRDAAYQLPSSRARLHGQLESAAAAMRDACAKHGVPPLDEEAK